MSTRFRQATAKRQQTMMNFLTHGLTKSKLLIILLGPTRANESFANRLSLKIVRKTVRDTWRLEGFFNRNYPNEIRPGDRLIRFGVAALDLSEQMPDTRGSNHLCGQLIRSATAPPLMYGEVNAAESAADFIHKMGMALKELRESKNCLKMIYLKKYFENKESVEQLIDENKQLIAIFGSSINTARKKNSRPSSG